MKTRNDVTGNFKTRLNHLGSSLLIDLQKNLTYSNIELRLYSNIKEILFS